VTLPDVLVTALAGISVLIVARPIVGAHPPEADLGSPARRLARAPRPQRLGELERDVGFALGQAIDVERLRPVLREVAAQRLAAHGIDLDLDPGPAAARLGTELWELVRQDHALPRDRHGPGIEPAALRAIVERLEGL
jgi:hypothetical protein